MRVCVGVGSRSTKLRSRSQMRPNQVFYFGVLNLEKMNQQWDIHKIPAFHHYFLCLKNTKYFGPLKIQMLVNSLIILNWTHIFTSFLLLLFFILCFLILKHSNMIVKKKKKTSSGGWRGKRCVVTTLEQAAVTFATFGPFSEKLSCKVGDSPSEINVPAVGWEGPSPQT